MKLLQDSVFSFILYRFHVKMCKYTNHHVFLQGGIKLYTWGTSVFCKKTSANIIDKIWLVAYCYSFFDILFVYIRTVKHINGNCISLKLNSNAYA
jgi:hypothetical protein